MSKTPEFPRWSKEKGIGSAEYFGRYLQALRRDRKQEFSRWASSAGLDEDRYLKLEQGEEIIPPQLDEINSWVEGWHLTRDEIIDLKISGNYDVSAYFGELDHTSILFGALRELDEYNRQMSILAKARMYFDVGRAFVGAFIYEAMRSRHQK